MRLMRNKTSSRRSKWLREWMFERLLYALTECVWTTQTYITLYTCSNSIAGVPSKFGPGACGLLYYCTSSVCILSGMGWLAVWRLTHKQNYTRSGTSHSVQVLWPPKSALDWHGASTVHNMFILLNISGALSMSGVNTLAVVLTLSISCHSAQFGYCSPLVHYCNRCVFYLAQQSRLSKHSCHSSSCWGCSLFKKLQCPSRWLHIGDNGSNDAWLCPIGFHTETSIEADTRKANSVGIGATKASKCLRCPLMPPLKL